MELATSSSLFPSPFGKPVKTRILFSPYRLQARSVCNHGRRSSLPSSPTIVASKAELVQRRSADYHPSIWNHELIDSFTTPYQYDLYGKRLEELKEEARELLASTMESCGRLKLIDSMQRLGVAYHFEEEIKEALNLHRKDVIISRDLHATALQFRLLREHGHSISSALQYQDPIRKKKKPKNCGEEETVRTYLIRRGEGVYEFMVPNARMVIS